ncbi:Kef-type K+ transport system membrane protein [Mizugakiibacter sediminis]|uniref:Kef-type K+ transport system membrane protein n=1 Tax=Mizugakiibacter sediminis TaxID=1475481 RepID=A0A0K8QSA5_9GAMM|nr:cation:proton antiporter [Mizugakiibacter sediminis]GAP67282.1 Kef-type K+ transport system membrane protein [Mizugakiibacter sediminis]
MHELQFIQDLAVVLLVAGCTTVLFQRLRQPVVLGYILAGVLIGPHTPPFKLIQDEQTIRTLSELGVILLLFSLGLEFSLKKLRQVGGKALVVVCVEVLLLPWLGFEIGRLFGWRTMDAVFLGAMITISSTTIIMKALDELGLKQERFAQQMFGLLIMEDIVAVVMMALLTGIASTGGVAAGDAAAIIGRLALFMAVALVAGLLLIPRLLDYVAHFGRHDVLLVTVLGVCFGFCLLVAGMGYSVALGAFMIGAIVAEARCAGRIEQLVEPVRDMFSAIFFVAIGLMIDPQVLVQYALPILAVTLAVLLGKVVACGFGAFVAGNDGRTALRIGMGMAQIGEFSFVIATLGLGLGVISRFLYPVAVAVSVLTTFLTPYLIRASAPAADVLARAMPAGARGMFAAYTAWLDSLRLNEEGAAVAKMIRRLLWHVAINAMLVVAVFIAVAFLYRRGYLHLDALDARAGLQRALAWSLAALLALPMIVAAYRKADALGLLLAELGIRERFAGARTYPLRRALAKLIPLATLLALALLVGVLGSAILPPRQVLLALLLVFAVATWFLWRGLVAVHARLQAAIKETLETPRSEEF